MYHFDVGIVVVSGEVEEETERCDPQSQVLCGEFMGSLREGLPFSCHVDVDVGLDVGMSECAL